jgi:hypothetical protein
MEDFSVDRWEFQVLEESLRAEAMFKEAASVVVATNKVLWEVGMHDILRLELMRWLTAEFSEIADNT